MLSPILHAPALHHNAQDCSVHAAVACCLSCSLALHHQQLLQFALCTPIVVQVGWLNVQVLLLLLLLQEMHGVLTCIQQKLWLGISRDVRSSPST